MDSQAHQDVAQIKRFSTIHAMFERPEARETMLRLVEFVDRNDDADHFVGTESSSIEVTTVVAPAGSAANRIVGVICPSRVNDGHIIPLLDFTARVIRDPTLGRPKVEFPGFVTTAGR